jgi:serine/threonine-protein kinase RIO1
MRHSLCRLILFKLLNSGFISQIDGCLSTGKEANVYYAAGKVNEGKEYAVKVRAELSSRTFLRNCPQELSHESYVYIHILTSNLLVIH